MATNLEGTFSSFIGTLSLDYLCQKVQDISYKDPYCFSLDSLEIQALQEEEFHSSSCLTLQCLFLPFCLVFFFFFIMTVDFIYNKNEDASLSLSSFLFFSFFLKDSFSSSLFLYLFLVKGNFFFNQMRCG